jgi:hypothetical protein
MNRKPPIGIMPKYIHDYRRHRELKEAITRFIDADLPVPVEWIEEYNNLRKVLAEHERDW